MSAAMSGQAHASTCAGKGHKTGISDAEHSAWQCVSAQSVS